MSESICTDCPLQASYETAHKKLLKNGNFHVGGNSHLAAALGALSFTRESHQEIAQKIDCDGPSRSGSSQIVCPLEVAVINARSFAEGPSQQQRARFDYESYSPNAGHQKESPNGNYL